MGKVSDPNYEEVANAIRLEVDENTNDVYIVFKITNEKFKQKIRENWMDDVELKVLNKKLIKKV